jgi:hypothetical protein
MELHIRERSVRIRDLCQLVVGVGVADELDMLAGEEVGCSNMVRVVVAVDEVGDWLVGDIADGVGELSSDSWRRVDEDYSAV